MPIIRNPFKRLPGDQVHDDVGRPVTSDPDSEQKPTSNPISIRTSNEGRAPTEYKLSEINDSGVFLPPSPTEKPKMRSTRSQASTASSSYMSVFSDNDSFNISRESFDSYRRSFDISARSPIAEVDGTRPRHSLEAKHLRTPPKMGDKHFNPPETHPEDRFEDVGLNDESAKPKKQSFLSRFGHSSENANNTQAEVNSRPSSSHFGSQLFGRKRGQSGQGSELAPMPNGHSPSPTPEIKTDR